MRNRSPAGSRALNAMRSLPAFVLSAILGIGFVAVVNRTHDLFAGSLSDKLQFVDVVPGISSKDNDKLCDKTDSCSRESSTN